MKPIRTALLCFAAVFACTVLFAQGEGGRGGFRGVQRGFGGRRNEAGSTPGMGFGQGGFGPGQQGGQGGFGPVRQGGQQGGFGGWNQPQTTGAETKLKRPFGAGQYDTSAFMAGDIRVNVVLFESNGKIDADTENWSKEEIARVIDHVKNACAWWEEMWKKQNFKGELKFSLDLEHATTPFRTSYEPISHGAFRDDRLWIGEYLNSLGYSGSKNQMLYQYRRRSSS